MSKDGKHVYVNGSQDDSVSWFDRNASTGALVHGGTFQGGETNGALTSSCRMIKLTLMSRVTRMIR